MINHKKLLKQSYDADDTVLSQEQIERLRDQAYVDFAFFHLEEILRNEGADALVENHWVDVICAFAKTRGFDKASPAVFVEWLRGNPASISEFRESLAV